jgi:hypothetical protein
MHAVVPVIAVVVAVVLEACGRDAPEKSPPAGAGEARTYTAAQKEALVSAGQAILRGERPAQVVPAAQRPALAEVHALVREIDVDKCLDQAGIIVGMRRRTPGLERVPHKLHVAAVGVSVVTREQWYQTVENLIDFCRRMYTELEQSGLDLEAP